MPKKDTKKQNTQNANAKEMPKTQTIQNTKLSFCILLILCFVWYFVSLCGLGISRYHEFFPISKFRRLPRIPLLDGADVADNARIDFALLLHHALRAKFMLSGKIPVRGTDAESGSQGKIRKRIFFGNRFDEFLGCFDVLYPLAQKSVKDGSARV